MSQPISRRTVLRGIGTALAIPALDAMMVNQSIAASPVKDPVRMAFLYVPNGMHMPEWTPSKTGKNFDIKAILKPIEAYKKKMNVLSGLTLNGARALGDGGGDHARSVAAFLTGAHPKKTNGSDIVNGASVDQVAAEKIGDQTRLPSLELGTEASAQAGRCDSGYSCVYTSNMSWRTETAPVAKEINPGAVFDRLFGNSNPKETTQSKIRREKYRQSILDFVQEDAKRLQKTLGVKDKQKLEEYLFAVRDIERRLQNSEKLNTQEADIPDYPRPAGVPRKYDEHVKLMLDMMVLAFRTDSTRVGTFMFTNAGSNRNYKDVGVSTGHHDLSHHGNNKKKLEGIETVNKYHMNLFKHFLDRLDSIKEGNGSLLDNCMVMYGSGIGDGNRHNHENLPITLVGSGGGSINTGRHIVYPKETPLTNLYLSMLDRVGARGVKKLGDSSGRLKNL